MHAAPNNNTKTHLRGEAAAGSQSCLGPSHAPGLAAGAATGCECCWGWLMTAAAGRMG